MRIYTEFDIESFAAWSGAEDTKRNILNAGKEAEFNALVDDIFPDGCTETEMNDYLRFDDAHIYEMLGLNEDGEEPEEEDETPEDEEEDEEGEQTDPADYAVFDDFCQDCAFCPFDKVCKTQEECKERFEKVKGGLIYA